MILTKMRFCNNCTDKTFFNRCNSQVNENKDFEANLKEVKRQPPNQVGHLLPLYKY